MRGKVLILVNHVLAIYNFRKELVEELVNQGYEVIISSPYGERIDVLIKMGCKFIDTHVERRQTNIIKDLKLLLYYIKILKKIKPDVVLTYTIKPNIYGGIVCRIFKKKAIHTVTGLGSVYIRNIRQKKLIVLLNRLAFKNAALVFFLNEDNKNYYRSIEITSPNQSVDVVPGSGVNLKEFQFSDYPQTDKIVFTFIARIIKDKGIEEYLLASEKLKKIYANVIFQVVGFFDEDKYVSIVSDFEKRGIIEYLGERNDIPNVMRQSNCIVLPSYGEGRGTVLQEGAAIGRALITTNIYGCKENVDDGINGYLCNVADVESLAHAMGKFIILTTEEKVYMGKKSREKAVREFDRRRVIEIYMSSIKKVMSIY